MKANEKKITRFLEGSDKHFVIPVYQRNYDWKKEQCRQLFDDLIDVSKTNRTHFLGSIVSLYNDNGNDLEYLVIDGQQRLTTVSILLLAIYKIIDNKQIQTNFPKEQIHDEYLVNKYSVGDKKIRLKPVKNDKDAFAALFGSEDNYILESNITVNFQYFYNRLDKNELSIDKLFSAIKQLVIVDIELKKGEDDPQLIFESLNSTGLDLTEADKVRNFILMKEDTDTQVKFYNNYWNKLEKNTNYNVSDYIRDYLTIKERNIPNKNKVYIHFKNYVINQVDNMEELLIDMLQFSTYYNQIINTQTSNSKSSQVLTKINKLESAISYPFIMELFHDAHTKVVTEDEICEALNIIVSFIFRRLICDIPTNALNKIFMVLGREIKKHDEYKENYLEILKYTLTQKKLSQRFPDDEEFSEKIVRKDVYNLRSKNRLFLLEQLENFDNKERVDIENLLNDKKLSIEHIMPQNLNAKWRKALGENHKIIHEKYLHTIGNLTLTGYNSKMQDKPFLEKRDMDKGFKESRLFLNKDLKSLDKWDEETIENRANSLKDRAFEIWKYPQSNFKPKEDNDKQFTLSDDDINFTGKRIISYKFMNDNEQTIKNWKAFYKQVAKILFDLDPIKFKHLIDENNYNYKGESNEKDAYKIGDFYIYTNLSVESILSRLRIIVEKIELDLNDITFSIK